jgi:hypothetical protein
MHRLIVALLPRSNGWKSEVPAKSVRNVPKTWKSMFRSSTVITEIFVSDSAATSMVATDAGRAIEVNDEQSLNAVLSIRFNFEPGSNDTVARNRQTSKQFSERSSTRRGIQIDIPFHPGDFGVIRAEKKIHPGFPQKVEV